MLNFTFLYSIAAECGLPAYCFMSLTFSSDSAGVPDLFQQCGSRSSEWHRGVQIPVCMGPLELPRESSAAVHTQQPAQRWVHTHAPLYLQWNGYNGEITGVKANMPKMIQTCRDLLRRRVVSPFCEIEMIRRDMNRPFGIVTVTTVAGA